jgi:hypothetical protein
VGKMQKQGRSLLRVNAETGEEFWVCCCVGKDNMRIN